VKDRSRPPFAFQELSATRAIREAYSGQKRMAALAIYQSMTEIANEHRARVGGHDEPFEAARREIADHAGCSPDTVDRYTRRSRISGSSTSSAGRNAASGCPRWYTLLTPGETGTPRGWPHVCGDPPHVCGHSWPHVCGDG
jgi:hypothetical protein